jgi:hypothetical protein
MEGQFMGKAFGWLAPPPTLWQRFSGLLMIAAALTMAAQGVENACLFRTLMQCKQTGLL